MGSLATLVIEMILVSDAVLVVVRGSSPVVGLVPGRARPISSPVDHQHSQHVLSPASLALPSVRAASLAKYPKRARA